MITKIEARQFMEDYELLCKVKQAEKVTRLTDELSQKIKNAACHGIWFYILSNYPKFFGTQEIEEKVLIKFQEAGFDIKKNGSNITFSWR